MKYVVFDIDGVLARPNPERMALIGALPGGGTDWEAFYATDFSKDVAIDGGVMLFKGFYRNRHCVHFVTFRREVVRSQTELWLRSVLGTDYWTLSMRRDDDERPSHLVKYDLLCESMTWPHNTFLLVDDEVEVVRYLSEMGYPAVLFKEEK